jgi:hypothetical protein
MATRHCYLQPLQLNSYIMELTWTWAFRVLPEGERESAIWVCFAIFGFCGIAMEKSRFSVFLWGCVGEE